MILLVGWYLWVVAIVLVLALILLGAILVQRRRRAGGVLSVRPRPKRDRQ
jgi:preprotein translocase subunit SecG